MIVLLAMVVAACGDDGADPDSLDSCEAVADASIEVLQDVIDEMDSMSIEDLAAMGSSEETPEQFKDAEERGMALSDRADELGCTDDQMGTLMAERAGDLSADSQFAQLIIESIRAGETDFFG
jgi:hypothetical protein